MNKQLNAGVSPANYSDHASEPSRQIDSLENNQMPGVAGHGCHGCGMPSDAAICPSCRWTDFLYATVTLAPEQTCPECGGGS